MYRLYNNKYLRKFLENFWRTKEAYLIHQKKLKTGGSIEKGIKNINCRWKNKIKVDKKEKPIFIFSSGWRSGSTLMQRLIMSSGKYFIWGEPFGGAGIIEKLANQFVSFTEDWPVEKNFLSSLAEEDLNQIWNKWIANLTPDIEHLISAHIAYLNRLFKYPLMDKYEGWGIKEVRLSYEHALYLKFIYPHSKFIFLVRNPLDAYRSYKRYRRWYIEIPYRPAFTVYSFAKFWKYLAEGFLRYYQDTRGILIKYEDLIKEQEKVIKKISEYLSLPINKEVLQKKVGSSNPKKIKLNYIEIITLKLICKKTANFYGYRI